MATEYTKTSPKQAFSRLRTTRIGLSVFVKQFLLLVKSITSHGIDFLKVHYRDVLLVTSHDFVSRTFFLRLKFLVSVATFAGSSLFPPVANLTYLAISNIPKVKPGSHLCGKHNTSDISISTRKKEHVPFFLCLCLCLCRLCYAYRTSGNQA